MPAQHTAECIEYIYRSISTQHTPDIRLGTVMWFRCTIWCTYIYLSRFCSPRDLNVFSLCCFPHPRENQPISSAWSDEGQSHSYRSTDQTREGQGKKGEEMEQFEEATNPLTTERQLLCWLAPPLSLPSPPLLPVWGGIDLPTTCSSLWTIHGTVPPPLFLPCFLM